MSELAGPELPDGLTADRRSILIDLCRLWLRLSDFRFGQVLRYTTVPPVRQASKISDEILRNGLNAALEQVPDRPLPDAPYWDTETRGRGAFLNGQPRDPARIPELLSAFAGAWIGHPDRSPGQLLELSLDRARIPENEFGTRWMLIEDAPLRRALQALTATNEKRGLP